MYPQIDVRLRLSDRVIDVTAEGLDVAFHLGPLEDSTLKVRTIADCPRLLCAAPAYIARRGMPADGEALVRDRHDCLNLRFPGAKEFQWTLQTPEGPRRFEITGPFESDDGDVLTGWALDGRGIVLKAAVRGGRPPARRAASCRSPPRHKVPAAADAAPASARPRPAPRKPERPQGPGASAPASPTTWSAAPIGRIAEGRQQQRHMVMRGSASPRRSGSGSRQGTARPSPACPLARR
jgi:hypothetical protein